LAIVIFLRSIDLLIVNNLGVKVRLLRPTLANRRFSREAVFDHGAAVYVMADGIEERSARPSDLRGGRSAGITAAPENTLATDKNKPLAGLGLFAASLLVDYGATLFIVIAPRISPGR
jgi:hypothetical protein